MTLQELIEDLSLGLGDYIDNGGPHSFKRWSVEFLQRRVHEARCTVATIYRRREHTRVLDIRVASGAVQDLGVHGHRVLRVIGVIDPAGTMVQRLRTSATGKRDWDSLWPVDTPPEPAWAPEAFTVTKVQDTDAILLVDPPIPTACEYRLRVVMEGVPPDEWDLTATVDAYPWVAAIRSYAMSEALASQVESPAALALSADHMKRFIALVGAARTADQEGARASQ